MSGVYLAGWVQSGPTLEGVSSWKTFCKSTFVVRKSILVEQKHFKGVYRVHSKGLLARVIHLEAFAEHL